MAKKRSFKSNNSWIQLVPELQTPFLAIYTATKNKFMLFTISQEVQSKKKYSVFMFLIFEIVKRNLLQCSIATNKQTNE